MEAEALLETFLAHCYEEAYRQYRAQGLGAADRERERALERACGAFPPEAQAGMDELFTLAARQSCQLHRLGFFQALALVKTLGERL